jgi:hypothetical protein
MVMAVEVTLYHNTLRAVGISLGGLDFNSSGQKAYQANKLLLAQGEEAAIADARDVKTNIYVFLDMKINY